MRLVLRSFLGLMTAGTLSFALPLNLAHAATSPSLDAPTKKEAAETPAKETVKNADAAIVPHKAIYMVKLGGTKNGSRISDLTGRMYYSWADDCHAWNVEQKMQLRFFYSEGEVTDSSSSLISREAKDGSSYDFHVRRAEDDSDVPEIWRGTAKLNDTGTGEASYSGEDARTVSLANTVFPGHHTLQLLQHARAGKKFFAVNVFDGADENGVNEISSFISDAVEAKAVAQKASDKKEDDNPLLKVKGWPVRMAFFAPKSETGSPDYEMDMVLLDNGIIKTMTVDYGDFAMTAELLDAKPLPAAKCGSF